MQQLSGIDIKPILIVVGLLLIILIASSFIEKIRGMISFGPSETPDRYAFEFNNSNKSIFKKINLTPTEKSLKTLGLSELPETEEELTTLYHTLAKKYHPDMNGGNNEKFIKITKAYKDIKKLYQKDSPEN